MTISRDPDARERSIAAIRDSAGPDNTRSDAALKHGARSPAQIAPARERHLDALRERFPHGDVTILGLQATRLAQLELVGLWLDGKGIMRNQRTGTIWPAADYWAKVASAFERQHAVLEAQQRELKDNGAADYFESERRALGEGSTDG